MSVKELMSLYSCVEVSPYSLGKGICGTEEGDCSATTGSVGVV